MSSQPSGQRQRIIPEDNLSHKDLTKRIKEVLVPFKTSAGAARSLSRLESDLNAYAGDAGLTVAELKQMTEIGNELVGSKNEHYREMGKKILYGVQTVADEEDGRIKGYLTTHAYGPRSGVLRRRHGNPADRAYSAAGLNVFLIVAGALGMFAFTVTNVTGAAIGAPLSSYNVFIAFVFSVVALVGALWFIWKHR